MNINQLKKIEIMTKIESAIIKAISLNESIDKTMLSTMIATNVSMLVAEIRVRKNVDCKRVSRFSIVENCVASIGWLDISEESDDYIAENAITSEDKKYAMYISVSFSGIENELVDAFFVPKEAISSDKNETVEIITELTNSIVKASIKYIVEK